MRVSRAPCVLYHNVASVGLNATTTATAAAAAADMLRKRRRGPPSPESATSPASEPASSAGAARQWTEDDLAYLQRTIDPLKSKFRIQPFGFLSAEATTMLCAPPTEVYERLTSMLTNISVVAGLVLSSIAGVALTPLDVESFAANKQVLAEIYNVMAAVAVITQLCVVLYSTFTLYIVISSAHNPQTVYRVLLHMVRWIGFFEFMTFIPPYLAIGLVVFASHLYCKWAVSAWLVTAVSAVFAVGFQSAFCYVMSHSLPYNSWAWATLASNMSGVAWSWSLSSRVRTAAQRHGEGLLAQAKEGVLAGLDEDDDDQIDQPSEHAAAAQVAMAAWVQGVLPLGDAKCQLLVQGLLSAGITHERMVQAAHLPGGFKVLVDMLAGQEGDLGLRPGERLALAAAAMSPPRARRRAPPGLPPAQPPCKRRAASGAHAQEDAAEGERYRGRVRGLWLRS